MSKLGLVLEGGGMRGAYTAGCLSWMIDNNIEVDYGVGISSGAMHLASYFMKNKKYLYDFSVTCVSDPRNIGIKPFLREGRYVGYKFMFDEVVYGKNKYSTQYLVDNDIDYHLGLYDLDAGDTLFFDKNYLDKEGQIMKASCSLPIAASVVRYNGKKYLDGGIKVMVPIHQALDAGCDKVICITTKPPHYVRQPAKWWMRMFMKICYPFHPQLTKDYKVRHIAYNEQMDTIRAEEKAGRCFSMLPTVNMDVKRFSGDPETLEKLYELGYTDMEARKEEFREFLNA